MQNYNVYSTPPCVKNGFEAQQLFGDHIGYIHESEYGGEESVLLREPSTYTMIAEGKNTIVLKIQRIHVHNTYPNDLIQSMMSTIGNREERLRKMVIAAALEKDRNYEEGLRK